MSISDKEALDIISSNYVNGSELINIIKWFNEKELDHILKVLNDDKEAIRQLIDTVQALHELLATIYPNREKLDKLYKNIEKKMEEELASNQNHYGALQ